MNKERLLRLADFLATEVPENQFSMDFWWQKNECGSVGCAAGWACQIPEFQKEGLSIQGNWPAFGAKEGFAALRQFFGLNDNQTSWLFQLPDEVGSAWFVGHTHSSDPTPFAVSQVIKRFVQVGLPKGRRT